MMVRFQKTEVIPHGQAPSETGPALRMVELCGRCAYKSEDRITEDSAESFVLMLKGHGHLSVLEHSNLVFKLTGSDPAAPVSDFCLDLMKTLRERNVYHRIRELPGEPGGVFAVAGNFRAWIETLAFLKSANPAQHDFWATQLGRFASRLFPAEAATPASNGFPCTVALMDEAEQLEWLKREPDTDLPMFIFKFICDRGITHEVVRHRVLSYTQESTRYVNYGNKGLSLILPEELESFYDSEKDEFIKGDAAVYAWVGRATAINDWYKEDLDRGLKPQIARDILPNLLKSELFASGRWSGWKHFVLLRESKAAHPRIRFLAGEVRKYFESVGMRFE